MLTKVSRLPGQLDDRPVGFDYPNIASLNLRGSLAEFTDVVDQVASRIDALVPIVDASKLIDQRGVRLRLSHGALVRVIVGPAAVPRLTPPSTLTVSIVVDSPGRLAKEQLFELLAQVERVGFSGVEMAELREQMPLTAGIDHHLPSHRLSKVSPILAIHHMADFLVMIESLIDMGVPCEAITVIDKGYRYRLSRRVDAHLRRAGITVWPWTRVDDALADHVLRAERRGLTGLLMDDGGYLLPALLDAHPALATKFCGLVEQTMSGIFKLERFEGRIPLPIFSVAESALKATIEPYGIADAAIRNVLAMVPNEKFEGQPAVVIGFGRIGEQIAEQLRSRHLRVAVYDRDIARVVAAHERGFLTSRSLPDLLRRHQPLLITGTTGRTSCRGEHMRFIQRDCYLVSTTSRTHEFALDELREESCGVVDLGVVGHRLTLPSGVTATVLADGYPINFHMAESLPNKYADLVLAALLVGAATLTRPDHGFAAGHNVRLTDQVLESCGLLERYYGRFGPAAVGGA